jgi:hypothetical protein
MLDLPVGRNFGSRPQAARPIMIAMHPIVFRRFMPMPPQYH